MRFFLQHGKCKGPLLRHKESMQAVTCFADSKTRSYIVMALENKPITRSLESYEA